MEDFIKRIQEEKTELDIKIEKLKSFMGSTKFKEISELNQELLSVQLIFMDGYTAVLNSRLNLLKN